jgi:hypothetical protein
LRSRRPLRGAATLAVGAALVALALLPAADTALARPAAGPVRVTASFDPDAALGGSTALDVDLRLDPRRLTTPLTEVRFEYPGSLGLVSSGLGLAACTRPPSDFAKVLIEGPRLGGCPPNSVMGYGTALAIVRLNDGQRIPEYASVTLLSGSLERGRLGLVVYVDGEHPFGAKLAFAGEVGDAPRPYGGALTVRTPAIAGIRDLATVSLVDFHITIGSHAIRYYEHRDGAVVAYHPDGIVLPARCPRTAFRFAARVGFADGSHRFARTTTPCPASVAAPARGR